MIDAHVSFSQPYSKEVLLSYVNAAKQKGLDELIILEPSYKFKECASLYQEVIATYPYQKQWYDAIEKISIREYQQFITEMRSLSWDITLRFGLCVTYFTQHEYFISQIKKAFSYDCFVGKIDFLDNIAFDWPQSHEMLWDKYNAAFLYRRYYEMMHALITSHLFDGVCGYDNIRTLKIPCPYHMQHTDHKLAMLLALSHMYVEEDSCAKDHGHPDALGLHEGFQSLCDTMHVERKLASHAVCAKDIGKNFR